MQILLFDYYRRKILGVRNLLIMKTDIIDIIISIFQNVYAFTERDILIHKCCQNIIDEIVDKVSKRQHSIEEKIEQVRDELKGKIRIYLTTYKKDEVNIGLSCLKAVFKVRISDTNNDQNDFEESMRLEEILNLILLENESEARGMNSIIYGSKNMEISFRLAYYYCVLSDNMEHYVVRKEKYNKLLENDLKLIFKEGYFYSEEYSNYMDSYLFMNLYEVPEDSVIKTPAIKERMQKKKLTIEEIRCLQESAVKTYLGFSFEDLRLFIQFLFQHQNNDVYFFMGEKDTVDELEKSHGIGAEVERIIDYFSMDFPLISSAEKINKIRLLELKSILKIDGSLLIYPLEFVYNSNCFEKIVLKKHFLNYLAFGLEDSQKAEFEKKLDKHEEKLSSFLAYALLDEFCVNGYIVPKCGEEPMAEITSIIKVMEDKKQKNILNDGENKGDIDVLAADQEKKEIYNIEIKYYQPLGDIGEMFSVKKENERNTNIVKPIRREQILYDNMEAVLRFLGLDPCEADKYKIKTIFVTPRPDYWLKKEKQNIGYYEWVEMLDGIRKKSL